MRARRLPMYFSTPLSLPDQRPISQRSTVGVGKHTDNSNFLITQRQLMIHSPIASERLFAWESDKLERQHKNLAHFLSKLINLSLSLRIYIFYLSTFPYICSRARRLAMPAAAHLLTFSYM